MTEDEAKTKWCPFARDDSNGANRFRYATAADVQAEGVDGDFIAETAASYPCIASACMAWRRTFLSQQERSEFVGRQYQLGKSKDEAYSMLNHMEEDNPSGYCGLAGAPQ